MQQKNLVNPDLEIPEDIVCPITGEIMTDPVLLVDSGNTYEREAILGWLEKNNTDPLSNEKLHQKIVVPNRTVKRIIVGFLDKHKKTNPDLINETYLPDTLIQTLISALQKNEIKLFREILSKDSRLLSNDLKDNKNLFILSCEYASLEILNIVLDKLADKIKNLACVQDDNGLKQYLTVSRRLGIEGAQLIANSLDWKYSDFQKLLYICVKNNDIEIVKSILSSGATVTTELLKEANTQEMLKLLSLFKNNIEKEEESILESKKSNKSSKDLTNILLEMQPLQPYYEHQKILKEHTSQVWCLGTLSDNQVVSGSVDETLKVWDLTKPKGKQCIQTLIGHSSFVKCIAVLSEKKIISGSLGSIEMDGEIKIWDLTNPKGKECIKTLRGHSENGIWSLATLSPDKVISGSNDYTLKIWDLTKPKGKECIKTLRGHRGNVQSIAVASEKLVVSGANDGTVKIWDISRPEGKELVKTLYGHTQFVTTVAAMSTNQIISGSDDGTIKVWNLENQQGKECVRTLYGHDSQVNCINILLPHQVASGSEDGIIKIWDIRKEKGHECIQTIKYNTVKNSIKAITILSDNLIVSANSDKSLKICSKKNQFIPDEKNEKILNKVLVFFKDESEKNIPAPEVALRRACSGLRPKNDAGLSEQKEVIRYLIAQVGDINSSSPSSGMTALHLAITKNQVESVSLLLEAGASLNVPDKKNKTSLDYALETSNIEIKKLCGIVSQIINNAHESIPLSLKQQVRKLSDPPVTKNQTGALLPHALEPHNSSLKTFGHQDNFFREKKRFDQKIPELACQRTFYSEGTIGCVAMLPTGHAISGGYPEKTLKVWDLVTGQCVMVLHGHNDYVISVDILPNGNVISKACDGTFKVWNITTGKCVSTIAGYSESGMCGFAMLPEGKIISGFYKSLELYDIVTGKYEKTFEGHSNWVAGIALLSNGHIISGSWDMTLKVWNVATGQCVSTLHGHHNFVTCVAALPNGQAISGSEDKTLKVWDIATGQCVKTLDGHSDQVTSLAVLPNGQVISGSKDKTLKVWDIATGQCLSTLRGHNKTICCITVTHTHQFISGSKDKTLKVWVDKSTLELEDKKEFSDKLNYKM